MNFSFEVKKCVFVGCGDLTILYPPLLILSEAKQTPQSWLRQSGSPAGEPKVKASDSISLDNQVSNSRAAEVETNWVRRGNGLRSKTHEPVLVERSEFTGECAEQLIENRRLSTAARRCGCRAGTARLLFFCRRFLFQIKRKCRNAESVKSLIIVGREDRVQILHSYRAARAATVRRVAAPYKCAPIKLYGVRGQMISAPTAHFFTIHFYLLL